MKPLLLTAFLASPALAQEDMLVLAFEGDSIAIAPSEIGVALPGDGLLDRVLGSVDMLTLTVPQETSDWLEQTTPNHVGDQIHVMACGLTIQSAVVQEPFWGTTLPLPGLSHTRENLLADWLRGEAQCADLKDTGGFDAQ